MPPNVSLSYSISYINYPKFMKTSKSGRHLKVSVTSCVSSETTNMEPMHNFLVPKYVLYDLEDGVESKVIQMIFQLSNVPHEFKRVQDDEYILEDYPFYALPMLEINDRKFGNVLTICRHLAWRYNLSGKTSHEDALVDEIAENVFTTRMKIKNWIDHIEHVAEHACDDVCVQNGAQSLLINKLFPYLEGLLHSSPSSWLVGHMMTWADLLVACLVNPIIYHQPKLLEKFPLLYLHNEKIAHHDNLLGYLYRVRQRVFRD